MAGTGLKKPLNMIETPIYPDIKKTLPRFRWSKKHWNVDVGSTLMETEAFPQLVQDAVLIQSRDYNKFQYGVSSHKDVVNLNFRPPLLTMEDSMPLNRLPRPITVPRINPATYDSYKAKNERANIIESSMTDREKVGTWRPTFYAPIDFPTDNSVLPDLEMKLPNVPASAGMVSPFTNEMSQQVSPVTLEYTKIGPDGEPGFNSPFVFDGHNALENIDLSSNTPYVSASSGVYTDVTSNNAETPVGELFYKRPSVAASAGRTTTFTDFNSETPVDDLSYNRPQVSASAGISNVERYTSLVDFDHNIQLDEKISQPHTVINPGPIGFDGQDYTRTETQVVDSIVQQNRPSYSYTVPQNFGYRDTNELSHKPHFQQRLQVTGDYRSKGFIPRKGIETQRVQLKKDLLGY